MARQNIAARQAFVFQLMERDGDIPMEHRRELATIYGCSVGSICADMKAFHDPRWHSAYRATHQVGSQNSRCAKLGVPGRLSKKEWTALCEEYGHRCAQCSAAEPLVIDHIVPISKGGTNTIDNIQPLCWTCNSRKSNR